MLTSLSWPVYWLGVQLGSVSGSDLLNSQRRSWFDTQRDSIFSLHLCIQAVGVLAQKSSMQCRAAGEQNPWVLGCSAAKSHLSRRGGTLVPECSSFPAQTPPVDWSVWTYALCCLRLMKVNVFTKLEGELLLFNKGNLRKKLNPGGFRRY